MNLSSFRRALVLALVAAAFALTAHAAAAPAHYLLHLRIAAGEHDHLVDLAVPWEREHGGSPFDFTDSGKDKVGVERLRAAWTALHRLPEGQSVTINEDGDLTRASRRGGYLVLEPKDRDNDGDARIRIPDGIVEALLRRDGRLDDADIEALLERHGKVTLVSIVSRKGGVDVWIEREAGRDAD
jgi:hypothetical protein